MGLALLLVVLKTLALRPRSEHYNLRPGSGPGSSRSASRLGRDRHPDGVPVRDELGRASRRPRGRHRPDARDGGRLRLLPRIHVPRLLLFGEKRLGPSTLVRGADGVLGSGSPATSSSPRTPGCSTPWPRGGRRRQIVLRSLGALLTNPWALWQYAHTCAAPSSPARSHGGSAPSTDCAPDEAFGGAPSCAWA